MCVMDFDRLITNLKEGTNFSWSRWGDGEFACICQDGKRNCDYHEYWPDLGEALRVILVRPQKHLFGLQRMASERYIRCPEMHLKEWTDNEILHRASINGYISLFFEALKDREVILIGNHTLSRLDKFKFRHIEIPMLNCWLSYDVIVSKIKMPKNAVVLYCAGMASNVLIDHFYREDITQIDCGSVFDPYVGRLTRSYHFDLKL